MDEHFRQNANREGFGKNLPLLLGMVGVYNVTVLNLNARTILPYFQGLWRFTAHLQQLDMESNGKGIQMDGRPLLQSSCTGPFVFGEPGTDGQHSFYQLLH